MDMGGIVLVTGAGRGIGAAIARGAGKRGFAVAVNYARSADGANKVVDEIKKAGGKAASFKADMTNEADIVALFEAVDRSLGQVTHLVNNAGIIGERSSAAAITGLAIDQLLRTNVAGPFLCIREAAKRMSTERGGKGGAIVNIGSIAARLGGFPGFAGYAASKAAVDGLTIALAKELGPQNIRVNCVRPGLTGTDMLDIPTTPDALAAMVKASVPYGGRVAQPDEIAAAVLWLLSDEASYVSGAIYDVSAGR
jgi:NAD(P)-dependent dehydrogenase (short-subunit alcohol dehydrogenase family)